MEVLFDMYTVLTKGLYLYNTHCIVFILWLFVTRVWLSFHTDREGYADPVIEEERYAWAHPLQNNAKIDLFFERKNFDPLFSE